MSRPLLLLAVGFLSLAGCAPDEIRTYTVPRATSDPAEPKVRLLGAILENGPTQWFFKLVGPTADIDKHAPDFVKFMESLRFTGKADSPVEWKPPASWEKGPDRQMRFATFFLGGKDKPLELTVFKFDQVSSLLDNVNRWCDNDLGRPHLKPGELDKVTRNIKAGPHTGVLVDMTGPGVRPGKRPPMMGGAATGNAKPKGGPKPLPVSYTAPAGWKETGPRSKMGIQILTTFQIREGKEEAEVQVTPIAGPAMELLPNVNRWRTQMGLGEISQADLDRDPPKKVRIHGREGGLVDLVSPAARQLVAWTRDGQTTWYFKMLGSKDLVGKNRPAFESFLQSVKFTGAADE